MILEGMKKWVGRTEEREREREAVGGVKVVNNGGFSVSGVWVSVVFSGFFWVVVGVGSISIDELLEVLKIS